MTVNSGSKHQKRKDTDPDTLLRYFKETFLMLHCQDQRCVAPTRCNSLIQSTDKRGGKESLFSLDEDRCDSLLHPATDAANPCLQESLHLIIGLLTFPHHPRSKIQPWIILRRIAEDNSKAQCWLFSTKNPPSPFIWMSKNQNNLKTR